MAVISRIEGNLDSRLTGQVNETTRPLPEKKRQSSVQGTLLPRGVDEVDTQRETTQYQTHENIQELVNDLQKTMDQYSAEPHEVGFRQDDATGRVIIEIRNPEGELLKQFPPEKVLNLHRRLDELSGIVIDRMT